MKPHPLFSICIVCSLTATFAYGQASNSESAKTVAQLIDDLTQISAQAPGIDSAAIYTGFIAIGSPGTFRGGVLGAPSPQVPPQMSELVRRGPEALPELIEHLDDARPTKLAVGNNVSGPISHQVGVDFFAFSYFSNEYDPRVPDSRKNVAGPMHKSFEGRYTVKVGDACYVLIGQIVNRRLFAVRYQPSAGLVVNSVIEAPELAQNVRDDWNHGDAEALKRSLLSDISGTNRPKGFDKTDYTDVYVNPALDRLQLYFPDAYNSLKGNDFKKRREFEAHERAQKPRIHQF